MTVDSRATTPRGTPLPSTIHRAEVVVGVAETHVAAPGINRTWGEDGDGSIVSSLTQTACDITGGGRFWIERGERVVVEAGPDDQPVPWLHATVGAFVLAQQGRFALHANVVDLGGFAIAVAGRRRAGKSTTSLALAAAGHRLVTDDVATLDIEGDDVVHPPAGRPVHIHPETAERLGVSLEGSVPVAGDPSKQALQNPAGEPVRVRGIVLLTASAPPGSAVTLESLEPALGAMVLHRHTYRRGLLAPLWSDANLRWASDVVERTPIHVLRRPQGAWTIDAVRATLEAAFRPA